MSPVAKVTPASWTHRSRLVKLAPLGVTVEAGSIVTPVKVGMNSQKCKPLNAKGVPVKKLLVRYVTEVPAARLATVIC